MTVHSPEYLARQALGIVLTCAAEENQNRSVGEIARSGATVEFNETHETLSRSLAQLIRNATAKHPELKPQAAQLLIATMGIRDTFVVCAEKLTEASELVGAMGGEQISWAAERVAKSLMGKMTYTEISMAWHWAFSGLPDAGVAGDGEGRARAEP